METAQLEIKDQVVELSTESFKLFCNDIADMFGLEIECLQADVCQENPESLRKRFENLAAVSSVEAEGSLHGTFQIVFDQGGLFTLAGVIVMMPEGKILEDIEQGSIEQAEQTRENITEVTNLLIGAWQRVFQEDLDGHGHFTHTNTFVGSLDNPEESIALPAKEEFVFVPYQITVNSYPTFNCGVILPQKIFDTTVKSDSDNSASTEQNETEQQAEEVKEQNNQQAEEQVNEESEAENSKEPEKEIKEETKEQQQGTEEQSNDNTEATEGVTESEKPTEEEQDKVEQKDNDKEEAAEKTAAKEESKLESEAEEQTASADEPESTKTDKESKDEEIKDKDEGTTEEEPTPNTETNESDEQPVSEDEQKTATSTTTEPTENKSTGLEVCAKDIMQKDVVWGTCDESVQQALAKMQQADAGYMLIGQNNQAEGIVSKSDLAGAISPYLRPAFAKWHRPQDDASLQIKLKWIMNRPIRTIKPETSLPQIMEEMSQFGGRCLPVMDEQGKIQGLVTVFDIFKVLLKNNWNITITGKSPQSPPLV